MSAALVQSAEGTAAVASPTPTLPGGATAGNLLVVVVGGDDYRTAGGIPTGFTESTGCKQETFLGHYLWWKVAAGGETTAQYTIGSASPSAWEIYEYSGLTSTPYDISAGQFAGSSGTTYTTPNLTPTAGDRLLLASIGGSISVADPTGVDTWLNSFTEENDTWTTLGSGTRDVIGLASLSVTANGSTAYSSGATYSGALTMQSRTAIIAAFKVAGAGGGSTARRTQHVSNWAVQRAANY